MGPGPIQIIQLLPGTYTATFTLPGFNTTKRDGIELSGSFVATVNAELRVGELAETITVTGETALVDVRSANVQRVVGKEIVDAVPTGRLGINLAALQPGMMLGAAGGVGVANTNALNSQDVGGTAGDTFTDLSIHGGKPAEQRQTIGGVSAATTIRFGESLSSSPSFTAMQEMTVNTSGADASMAPAACKSITCPVTAATPTRGCSSSPARTTPCRRPTIPAARATRTGNCTPAESMFCRGLTTQPGALKNVYDVNPGYGGPIVKDKLWFFATARWTAAENYVPNNYYNLNFTPGVTSPTLLNRTTAAYTPDTSQDLLTTLGGGGRFWEQTVRLSYQMTQKHKFGIYYNNKKRESYDTPQIANAPESRLIRYFFPFSDQLVQWSSPQTNRLLLEAGFWRHQETWGNKRPPTDIADPLAVGITDNNPQNTTGYAQLIQNYHGRVGETDTASHNPNYRSMFNLSYVTGSHSFKTGFDLNGASRWSDRSSVVPYSLVVSTLANNGAGIGIPVPLSITLRSDGCTDPLVRQVNGGLVGGQTSVQPYCPTPILQKVPSEGGAFVQDRWTMDKLTISAGLRIDWFYSEIPTVHFGPSMITPNRNYDVPGIKTTEYKDWTPKVAAAYDLFGNGRTALKVNYGKYVLGQALGGLTTQGAYNVQLTSSRNWVDNDRDFVPDCDLTRNTTQGPTAGRHRQPGGHVHTPPRRERELLRQRAATGRGRAGRGSLRLGQAAVQLGDGGRGTARAEPGHLGHRRRLLAVVRQLPGHRQHLGHGTRLHGVLDHAVADSACARIGGRRKPAERPQHGPFLQHQPGRGGEQRDRPVEAHVPRQQRLRPLVRLRPDGELPPGERGHAARRPGHGPPDHGLLRRAGSGHRRRSRAGGDAGGRRRRAATLYRPTPATWRRTG